MWMGAYYFWLMPNVASRHLSGQLVLASPYKNVIFCNKFLFFVFFLLTFELIVDKEMLHITSKEGR